MAKDLIRLGKISALNYEAGTARVVYHDRGDSVTAELPLLSTEYKMPSIGDQVLVLHLSNGSAAGVVLGRPWSSINRPPESGEGLYRKDFAPAPGDAFLKYQDGTITIKADKIILQGLVEANEMGYMRNQGGALSINADSVSITGGGVTLSGGVVADGVRIASHTHNYTKPEHPAGTDATTVPN